ncbi:MAG: tRNA uridine-5-carboxymethylaminomethyl(34) synthesis GTPase MnmE [Muribaculaceae bacterium]|nr:tRNA uridine-5-carboxymethylaminomethyl(34) synthesis GTPase MnmE [Muribaculaceae bacterium]
MIYDDTICAISTPPGVGGIAVARISGPSAIDIAGRIWQGPQLNDVAGYTARYGTIVDPATGEELDQGMATVFRTPRSYTGENVVELSVHGSRWIQRELVNLLLRQGCRLAEPGEFTRRAFASGKLDLAEAEGVADMIASSSRAAHRIAMTQMRGEFSRKLGELHDRLLELASLLELELDFSEEEVEFASRRQLLSLASEIHTTVDRLASTFSTGAAIKDGIPVAIVGATNAGKSTLLNRLLRDDRAIVSDIHGTTRDVVEDTVEVDGVLLRFIDTAGLRSTDDTIETLGIGRTIDRLRKASIVLWVIDASAPETLEPTWTAIKEQLSEAQIVIAVVNKTDRIEPTRKQSVEAEVRRCVGHDSIVPFISARDDESLRGLEETIVKASGASSIKPGDIMITNQRHYQALVLSGASISRAIEGLQSDLPGDLIAQDIRETLHHLATITGRITTADILATIFTRFCIGK